MASKAQPSFGEAVCPKCGAFGSELRHRLYVAWHDCKKCGTHFWALCKAYKHGLPQWKQEATYD